MIGTRSRVSWVLAACVIGGGCGDDGAHATPDAGAADVGEPDTSGSDAGGDAATDDADAGQPNTCLDPERQSLPCCWERTNEGRDEVELIVRAMRFHAPEATANVLFDGQIQSAFDEGRVPWLIDVRDDGGATVVRTGFGIRDEARESYRFSLDDAPPPGEPTRRQPVSMAGELDGDGFRSESAAGHLVIPLIGGAEPDLPQPEITFRRVRFLEAPTTDAHTCVGARTPSRRWSFGEPPSRVEAYMHVQDARATVIAALGDVSFCTFLASRSCDEPRASWETPPDARCEDDGTCRPGDGTCARDSDDPATGCNAWRFEISFAAAGVEIE